MFSKRKLLAITTFFAVTTVAGISPALAIGGNDPIPGVDIIILKDPSSQPITSVPFGSEQLAKLNALRNADRPVFVLETVAARIGEGEGFVKSGMAALGKVWCGTCEMADSVEVKFREGAASYQLALKFQTNAIARPIEEQKKARALPKIDRQKMVAPKN